MSPHGITSGTIALALGQPATNFTQDTIDRVVESVREICGWHVFPVREETLTLPTTGDCITILPSKRVLDVSAVVFDGKPVTEFEFSEDGVLYVPEGLKQGLAKLKVTLRHGFETPKSLVGVIAQMVSRANTHTGSYTVGHISVGASQAVTPQSTEWRVIDLYKLGALP